MPIADIKVTNETPPEWNAIITGIVTEFQHKDGGKSEDHKSNTNIPSGSGEEHLFSANACVVRYTLTRAVRVDGKVQLVQASYGTQPGTCITGDDVAIGQAHLEIATAKLGFDAGNARTLGISGNIGHN